MAENKELEDKFIPLPVHELFNGKYQFVIPSFQRGYRWEWKQVNDLLDDIYSFSNNPGQTSYYLQPIVVKQDGDQWEVLDGQQRLTTMLLILKKVIDTLLGPAFQKNYSNKIYSISYKIRPKLSFDDPDFKKTIDGYYLAEAKGVIDRWFKKKLDANDMLTNFQDCLLSSSGNKHVKFIWYETKSDSTNKEELLSINIFNRLNKGRIGLTSSELIKALFVLNLENGVKGSLKDDDDTASGQLVMEWNEIERKFQDDRFWLFISNDQHNVQTRIDLLFDFLTKKPKGADSDYSYRLFQNLYDASHSSSVALDQLWKDNNIDDLEKAWRHVKKTYDRLVSWYEDNIYYHYVGFLVSQGSSPMAIFAALNDAKSRKQKASPDYEWTVADIESTLKRLIAEKFSNFCRPDIDKLDYSNGSTVRKLLLLFNVESCVRTANQRFKFDEFKKEKWDIEHVDSQNSSCLQKPKDKMNWLGNVIFTLKMENSSSEDSRQLLQKCTAIMNELKKMDPESLEFSKEKYDEIYSDVNKYFSFDAEAGDKSVDDVDLASKDKNNINNLTLLNSDINRSYKDAPFPYKRYFIIEKDKEGSHFIPIGTRNLFLKYFSSAEHSSSGLNLFRWNEADKASYLEHIHSVVDSFFNEQ